MENFGGESMLHVLLLVLKVIAIALLILIGILISILLLILLAPFRYSVDAEYYNEFKAEGHIRWLIFVLDFKGTYSEHNFIYYLRSFGGIISTNDPNKQKKRHRSNNKHEDISFSNKNEIPYKIVEDDFEQVLLINDRDDLPTSKDPMPLQENFVKTKQKHTMFIKIKNWVNLKINAIVSIPKRIKLAITKKLEILLNGCRNIKKQLQTFSTRKEAFKNRIGRIKKIYSSKKTKKAIASAKRYFKQLWKHLHPRKFHANIHFGFEDPCNTGETLGLLGIAFPIYQNHIVLSPDFEQKVLEGYVTCKGRIRIGTLLAIGLRIILDKNLMTTIQQVKQL